MLLMLWVTSGMLAVPLSIGPHMLLLLIMLIIFILMRQMSIHRSGHIIVIKVSPSAALVLY